MRRIIIWQWDDVSQGCVNEHINFQKRFLIREMESCLYISIILSPAISRSQSLSFRCSTWKLTKEKNRNVEQPIDFPKNYSVTIKCTLKVRGLSQTSFSSLIPFRGRPCIINRNWPGSFKRLRKWRAEIPCSFTISKWLSSFPLIIVYSMFSSCEQINYYYYPFEKINYSCFQFLKLKQHSDRAKKEKKKLIYKEVNLDSRL